ncbi:MAG: ATP-binding protein [Thermoplasmata archaeon]|nr:ATP-binding protein [Thermoplasmata archaeon]
MKIEELLVEFQRYGIPEVRRRELVLPLDVRAAITVTGLRRVGKTYLLYQTMKYIKEDIGNIFYINFEDERLEDIKSEDLSKIVELYRKYNPDAKRMYLFLDEIQNVPGWEKFVRRILERRDARIFLTGSSSKLLSREIATSLRGRSISFTLLPLSFREFLRFKGFELKTPYIEDERGLIMRYLDEYVKFGGFPEIVECEEFVKLRRLQEYLQMIIYRDLIERYGIDKVGMMKALIRVLVKNFALRTSVKKLHNMILSSGGKLSKNKVYEYFSYLEDIGFVIPVRRFSFSEVESARSKAKNYLADVAFPTLYGMEHTGRRMENIVALELLRRKYYGDPRLEIGYYYAGDKEVDFVVSRGFKVEELIQVSYDVEDPETGKRELRALDKAGEELRCKNKTVITWDYEEEGEVRFIPLWKWLLYR